MISFFQLASENKCDKKIRQNETLPAVSMFERALSRSLNKNAQFPQFLHFRWHGGWYELEVCKHITRPPKHICDTIDLGNKRETKNTPKCNVAALSMFERALRRSLNKNAQFPQFL